MSPNVPLLNVPLPYQSKEVLSKCWKVWQEPQDTHLYNCVSLNTEALERFKRFDQPAIDKALRNPELPEFVTLIGEKDWLKIAVFKPTAQPDKDRTLITKDGVVVSAQPMTDVYLIEGKKGKAMRVTTVLVLGLVTPVVENRYGKKSAGEPVIMAWQIYPDSKKLISPQITSACINTYKVIETLAKHDEIYFNSLYARPAGKVLAHWRKVKPSKQNGGKTRIWVKSYHR